MERCMQKVSNTSDTSFLLTAFFFLQIFYSKYIILLLKRKYFSVKDKQKSPFIFIQQIFT